MKLFLSLARARLIVSRWDTAALYLSSILGIYLAGFFLLYDTVGESASALVLVPVIGTAAVYGVPGGIIAGLAGYVLSAILLSLVSPQLPIVNLLADPQVIFPNILVVLAGLALGWLRDLSERLLREMDQAQALAKELEESRRRYHLATIGTSDGIWDWDVPGSRILYSARWAQMLGHREGAVSTSPREWLDRIHPADRQKVRSSIAACFASDAEQLSSEHRLHRADGQYIWVHARASLVRNDRGRVMRVVGAVSDITERTVRDPLTRLPNRLLFMEQLSLIRNQRPAGQGHVGFAVAMVDIDEFSFLNGTLGTVAGDSILVAVAGKIRNALRSSDALARADSDRFLIAFAAIADPAELDAAIRRVIREAGGSITTEGREAHYTVTAGVVVVTDHSVDNEDLLSAVELTVKQAKQSARGDYIVYNEHLHRSVVSRFELSADLRGAADRHELSLRFQPIVELPSRRPIAAEVLVRWNHPTQGLLAPGAFIPIAEADGQIVALSEWVLRETVRRIAELRDAGFNEMRLDVNLSGVHFASSYGLPQFIADVLESQNLPGSLLGIEITETSLLGNQAEAIALLEDIRSLGVHCAIDDFGTGYSTLDYLRRLPVDTVKIDRSFVVDCVENRRDRAMLSSLVRLGKSLDLRTLAEGVELEEQLGVLAELECDMAQGYVLARPLEWPAFVGAWDLIQSL